MSQRGGNPFANSNSMNEVELRNNTLQAYSQTYTPLGVESDEPSSEHYLLNDMKVISKIIIKMLGDMNIPDEEVEPVYESIIHHYFTNPRLTVAERVRNILFPGIVNLDDLTDGENVVVPQSPYYIDTNMKMFSKSGNLMSGNIPFDLEVGLDGQFQEHQFEQSYLKQINADPVAFPDFNNKESMYDNLPSGSNYLGLVAEAPPMTGDPAYVPESGEDVLWRLQLGNENQALTDSIFENVTGIDSSDFTNSYLKSVREVQNTYNKLFEADSIVKATKPLPSVLTGGGLEMTEQQKVELAKEANEAFENYKNNPDESNKNNLLRYVNKVIDSDEYYSPTFKSVHAKAI